MSALPGSYHRGHFLTLRNFRETNMLLNEKLKEVFMPSLKHRALVKIALLLWNRSDITDLNARSCLPNLYKNLDRRPKEWRVLQDKIMEKVPKLSLPESLIKEVMYLIQAIGLEILKWKKYEILYLYETQPTTELCWTQQGTVDKKKTAEALIKNESLDVTYRYSLACVCCFEVAVKELWNSLPQGRKDEFYQENQISFNSNFPLLAFWSYNVNGEETRFNDYRRMVTNLSPYQYQFECSANLGNKAATEYFLKKLTPRERNESLVRIAQSRGIRIIRAYNDDTSKEYEAEVLRFLLSQMNEEQQVKLFESNPSGVLSCFLDWPWQSFFMEMANRMWNFLSEEKYEIVLRMIVDKIMAGYMDCNYYKLFGEFWQQSPNSYKKYVLGRCANGSLLISKLFQIEDQDNLRLILRDATVKEREKIIFHEEGKNICQDLIDKNKWDLLNLFVQECITSADTMIKFKEDFQYIITQWLDEKDRERRRFMEEVLSIPR